jgi:hypothetical protein
MSKRNRLAATELVEWPYVERHKRKGWLERDFNIAGCWFLWRKNIATERGLLRVGVADKSGKASAG